MHNVLIAFALMQAGQAAPPATAPAAPQSQPAPCPVSTDAEFGRVPAKPIRVGGAGVYMASRQRRYFESVRGPGGETVTATRRGSAPNAGGERGMVDVYEVTYEGLDKPLTLYVDSYHYENIAAPQGFQCVEDRLGPPPVDALLAMEMGERLAIDEPADRVGGRELRIVWLGARGRVGDDEGDQVPLRAGRMGPQRLDDEPAGVGPEHDTGFETLLDAIRQPADVRGRPRPDIGS